MCCGDDLVWKGVGIVGEVIGGEVSWVVLVWGVEINEKEGEM